MYNKNINRKFWTNAFNLISKAYKIRGYNSHYYLNENDELTKNLLNALCGTIVEHRGQNIYINNSFKVYSIFACCNKVSDYCKKADAVTITIMLTRNYDEYFISDKMLNEKQANAVLDIIKKYMDEKLNDISISKNNPRLSKKLNNEILCLFNKYLDDKTLVSCKVGKLNKEQDVKPYNCFVMTYLDGEYKASVKLERGKYGEYTLTTRVPLSGEFNVKCNYNELESVVKEISTFINN